MLLYEDILTGDEMFSDAFPVWVLISYIRPPPRCLMLICERELRKLIEDIVYEVDCSMVTVKPGADVDIGTVYSQTGNQDSPLILNRR